MGNCDGLFLGSGRGGVVGQGGRSVERTKERGGGYGRGYQSCGLLVARLKVIFGNSKALRNYGKGIGPLVDGSDGMKGRGPNLRICQTERLITT